MKHEDAKTAKDIHTLACLESSRFFFYPEALLAFIVRNSSFCSQFPRIRAGSFVEVCIDNPHDLNVDPCVAALWGDMQGKAEKRGDRLPVIDSLIASTALHHDLTVVSRNEKDMKRCGVRVMNPCEKELEHNP